ncbi:MAG: exonuclease SbcCD subunit D [Muribaculaceae bacterium]|nr:exonuclease SbcCD subunit D [Muribaculaceae bacterium]
MKIIHTSDWHLGHVLYNYDRSAEQRAMLRQIADVCAAEQPDALLVSGDVFHNAAPAAAAQQLLVEGLLAMRQACPAMPIVVTAGNHDSAARLEATAALWQLAGVFVVGHLARDPEGRALLDHHIVEIPGKGWVAAVPHAYPVNFPVVGTDDVPRDQRLQAYFAALLDRVAERNAAGLPVVLMAHLSVAGSDFTGHDNIGTLDTLPIEALGSGFDYAALGHIHRPQTLGTNSCARYCGTPLAVSFDEQCEHSVSVVTLNSHSHPHIDTRRIVNPRALRTIPAGAPVPLDEALELLRQLSSAEPAYVRLNVLVDGYVPADARHRAAEAVSGKQCRFCTLKVTSKVAPGEHKRELSVSELRESAPIDVARAFILEKTGNPMTERQEAMFGEAERHALSPSE